MRLRAFASTLVLALAVALGIAAPSRAGVVPIEDPVKARLVAETGSIAPGETVWVALHLAMRPGWHVYWRNPGDAGLPPEIAWKLPPGFTAGEIAWPTPERFVVGEIGNYGYAGAVDLLVPITAPADLAPGGDAPIAAHATWLACAEICIPGEADLALALRVAAAPVTPDPAAAALFAAARERLPQAAGFTTQLAASGSDLMLRVPAAALAGRPETRPSRFFRTSPTSSTPPPSREPSFPPSGLDVRLKRASGPTAVATLPPSIDGVLALRGGDGTERSYAISAPVTAGGRRPRAGCRWGERSLPGGGRRCCWRLSAARS